MPGHSNVLDHVEGARVFSSMCTCEYIYIYSSSTYTTIYTHTLCDTYMHIAYMKFCIDAYIYIYIYIYRFHLCMYANTLHTLQNTYVHMGTDTHA
jgi:hypothetical protein